jgi:hypothetical protein
MMTASNAEKSIDNTVRNYVDKMNADEKTIAKDPIIKKAGSSLLEVSPAIAAIAAIAIANHLAEVKLAKPQLPNSTPSNQRIDEKPMEMMPATKISKNAKKAGKKAARPQTASEEQVSFASKIWPSPSRPQANCDTVLLSEKIADYVDAQQAKAVAENRSNDLLNNVELVKQSKEIFRTAMKKSDWKDVPLAMTLQQAQEFLGRIRFCKNYLVHVRSREYLDGDGSVVASGSSPRTPGIGGWIHFAKSNTWVCKGGGYGDEVVEEVLRRGVEGAK